MSLSAQEQVTFVGVALDVATREADRKLTDLIYQKAGVRLASEELEYGRAIERLVNWRAEDGYFIARTTPYVYVVAEMLGAQVEPLATYVSTATNKTTYRSYFVVSRERFPAPPSLPEIVRFLSQSGEPARFAYHSQFSTSSYYLPLLFFRANRIFSMREPTESLVPINPVHVEGASSSKLIELVASEEADLAAVWDGTKAKYESSTPEASRTVHFVPLPTQIPNDLLLASSNLPPEVKERIRKAIGALDPDAINIGDFKSWTDFAQTTEARVALADLRWSAVERTTPVTVDIQVSRGTSPETGAPLVRAARRAIALANNEFVPFDPDYHQQIDVKWTLQPIHDGAVTLHSSLTGDEVDAQQFRLSFNDEDDLTRRIVWIIQTRLHRIRQIWPFGGTTPMVIRDTPTELEEGSSVKVQKITWLDPARNRFRSGQIFPVQITKQTSHRFELEVMDFSRGGGFETLDPMSNSGYRVLLLKKESEPMLFRVTTFVLVLAFVLAGLAAMRALVRFYIAAQREASSPGEV